MSKKNIASYLSMFLAFLILAGCRAHMSPLHTPQSEQYLFTKVDENQAQELIYETLVSLKPDAVIQELSGPIRGYSAAWTWALDHYRTNVRILYGRGISDTGEEVTGLYPDVSGSGSLLISGPAFSEKAYKQIVRDLEEVSTRVKVTKLRGIRRSTALIGHKSGPTSGSGVIINPDGFVLTNHHVTDKCGSLKVSHNNKLMTASVFAKDEINDISILQTPLKGVAYSPIRNSSKLQLAEPVMVLGFPLRGLLSEQMHATSGDVTALAGIGGDSRFFQTSAPIQPGNSGGPIVDRSANVIGLATSKLNAIRVARVTGDIPQNVNFGLKTAIVINFLDSLNIGYKIGERNKDYLKTEIVETARAAVVTVLCNQD